MITDDLGPGLYSGCCRVNYQGEPAYMTVAHGGPKADDYTFPGCTDTDITGLQVYQGSEQIPLGNIAEYDYDKDFSIIVPDDYENDLSPRVHPGEGPVFGHVTEDGVDDSMGEPVRKFGACTGSVLAGDLYDHRLWGPCGGAWKTKYVFSKGHPCAGDSGGPNYIIESLVGNGRIVGLIGSTWGKMGDHSTIAPAFYEIANDETYDVSVGDGYLDQCS